MKRFKDILVAVDLSDGDWFVTNDIGSATEEAIGRGLWLAKTNSAALTFFYSLDVCAKTQRLIEKSQGIERTVMDEANDVLSTFVDRARRQGINANHRVGFGKSWVEIIRKVLRGKHDLVVAGTRQRRGVQQLLLGSTGMKLLRKCPCPVWVTKPMDRRTLSSILVATDFSPAAEMAWELGVSMAQLQEAELHVLHVLEFGRDDHLKLIRNLENDTIEYRERVHAEAMRRLEVSLATAELPRKGHIHLLEGQAVEVIVQQLEEHKVDLLVMATLARTGVSGVLVGNTAERLLMATPCSILAVKPAGFESPIRGG